MIEAGFRFHLVYVWLPSPEACIARVAERVRGGGHDVPEEVIRRRYAASLRNFFELYRPLADTWEIHDNSVPPNRLIAEGHHETASAVYDEPVWNRITQGIPGADIR